jgi:hypothetical protein
MIQTPVAPEWQTPAEQNDYRTTPNYADTVSFAKRLADASPSIEFKTFGVSGQGRELPLLIASEANIFSPREAIEKELAVVLVQACIHAGEPDGKDAGFALLRDIAITKISCGFAAECRLAFYSDLQHRRARTFESLQSYQSKRTV